MISSSEIVHRVIHLESDRHEREKQNRKIDS